MLIDCIQSEKEKAALIVGAINTAKDSNIATRTPTNSL